MSNFTIDSFTKNFLKDKQPALSANFKMNFVDDRLKTFLPEDAKLEDLNVLGFISSIPASQLSVLQASYIGGFITPIPGKIQPQNMTMIFYENNAYHAEQFFSNWKAHFVELYPEQPESLVSTDSEVYKIDLQIDLMNNQRQVTTRLRLKNAFPFSIVIPDYSWAQSGQLPVVQVGLVYEYCEFENV